MKLKNKKTGEIVERCIIETASNIGAGLILQDNDTNKRYEYNSFSELNEEWEDYEGPKDFWYIDDFMIMCGTEGEFTTPDLASFTKKDIEKLKAIGNYFETKAEAEKAVEKLKAWKQLRDKGFRFVRHGSTANGEHFVDYTFDRAIPVELLDLLFGGEE